MEALELTDYRAAVARMYLDANDLAEFRACRDKLVGTHPQSAIPAADRATFTGLTYFPANDDAIADVDLRAAPGGIDIDTGGPDGVVHYDRVGILDTPWGELSLWWIAAYGGGRYLTDTVKGTHGRGVQVLGGDRVRLDFNYLYNPSCAYDDQWLCPLAPPENRLNAPLRAGELKYH